MRISLTQARELYKLFHLGDPCDRVRMTLPFAAIVARRWDKHYLRFDVQSVNYGAFSFTQYIHEEGSAVGIGLNFSSAYSSTIYDIEKKYIKLRISSL